MKLLAIVWFIFATSILSAQSEVRVLSADLGAAFGAVTGKLVVQDATLTFVDLERPEASFAVDKTNVQSITRVNDSLVVQLKQAVKDRVGDSTRLSLRIAAPNESAIVEQWFQSGLAAGKTSADSTKTATADRWSYPARRDKLLGGTDGTLVVTPERIIFESLDKAEESRRWDLKEIKELKRKNPYQVEIIPFQGDKYDLKLSGSGMESEQFRQMVDWITRARTARP
ncbi:MAG: hypothetical protein ABI972_13505 [Acidobacteriota bacterium]